MLVSDGDGFVSCVCGERHWGLHGAAGLLLTDPERGVLLQHRAGWTHHGQTWALPGGAVGPDETPAQAAMREAEEEAAVPSAAVRVRASWTIEHGTWRYTTVLATPCSTVRARVTNAESTALHWVLPHEVENYPLHRDFAAAWPHLRTQLDRRFVLIVNAADVVDTGPGGGGRDGPDVVARFRDRLATRVRTGVSAPELGMSQSQQWRWWPQALLVVPGQVPGVDGVDSADVIATTGDGDSVIVRTVRELRTQDRPDHVVVATADRHLTDRVATEGAGVIAPSAVWRLLEQVPDC